MVKMVNRTVKAMAMPFTISIANNDSVQASELADQLAVAVEAELRRMEDKFSAFKVSSLVCQYQSGQEAPLQDSDFLEVYTQTLAARLETQGYFDPYFKGPYNPTGFVKGWAIERVFYTLLAPQLQLSYVEGIALNGAGDMQVATRADSDFVWKIGIENPRNLSELIAIYDLKNGAVATSGSSKKGNHLAVLGQDDLVQVTVVGEKISQVDLWATAGFSAGQAAFEQLIAQHQLSGLFLQNQSIHLFQEGTIQHVQTF